MKSFLYWSSVVVLLVTAFMALGTLCPCAPGPAALGTPCCDLCPPWAAGSCCPSGGGVCWTGSGQGISEDNSPQINLNLDAVELTFVPPVPPEVARSLRRQPEFLREPHSIAPALIASEHLLI